MPTIQLPSTRPYDAVKLEDKSTINAYRYVWCSGIVHKLNQFVDLTHLEWRSFTEDECYYEMTESETQRLLSELKDDTGVWLSAIFEYLTDTQHSWWDGTGNMQWIEEVDKAVTAIVGNRKFCVCKKAVLSKAANFELSEAATSLLKTKHGINLQTFDKLRNLEQLVDVVEILGDYASAVPGDFVVVPLEPKSRYVVDVKDGKEKLSQYHKTYDVESGEWKEPDGIVFGCH
jgi:hypothetical protein